MASAIDPIPSRNGYPAVIADRLASPEAAKTSDASGVTSADQRLRIDGAF